MLDYTSCLTAKERQWLKTLDAEIWIWREGYDRFIGKYKYPETKRALKPEEWRRLQIIIKRRHLICIMENWRFAFGVRIDLYDQASEPRSPPPFLIAIGDEHLPQYSKWPRGPERKAFKKSFKTFSKFTHSALNRQYLAHYKLPPPHDDIVRYDY